eukprot:5290555-Amphidinium_carterae.1
MRLPIVLRDAQRCLSLRTRPSEAMQWRSCALAQQQRCGPDFLCNLAAFATCHCSPVAVLRVG